VTGDIQVPSALPLKLPSELTLGGEPLRWARVYGTGSSTLVQGNLDDAQGRSLPMLMMLTRMDPGEEGDSEWAPVGAGLPQRHPGDPGRRVRPARHTAGTLAGKPAAAGAVADFASCRPCESSQQIAEIRIA
jgi:hypothetical protein